MGMRHRFSVFPQDLCYLRYLLSSAEISAIRGQLASESGAVLPEVDGGVALNAVVGASRRGQNFAAYLWAKASRLPLWRGKLRYGDGGAEKKPGLGWSVFMRASIALAAASLPDRR
jgi:hypothetical protein